MYNLYVTVTSTMNCYLTYLARKWQPFLHITPSAVLVLWNFLMYAHYVLISRFTDGSSTEVAPASWYKYGFVILTCFGYCSFLFLGFLVSSD